MAELSRNELLKAASAYLRGTIAEGLEAPLTGAIAEDDTQLTKFHGLYLQDDRDLRPERRKKRLEPAFAFMARVRLPGGVCTPQQWLQMDRIAGDYANGTLRLTTRQTWQFHGVIKQNLRRTMQAIDRACLDTIAACGDVNRNVMCTPNPHVSRAHGAALELARAISDHLLPQTRAYREIWLEGEKIAGGEAEDEPIYGKTYLPRKFKTVVAVPPDNDVDVFAHDLGFIAVVGEDGSVEGWNVTVGGGMGMTHGEPATYPRTADVMAFCRPEQAVDVAEKVVLVQRDFGDRTNRKHARLKYTDRGPRRRLVPGRGRAPPGLPARGSRGRSASPTPATATAGPRTGRATGTSRCSSRTAASRTRPSGRCAPACARSPRSTRASSA